MDPRDDAEGVAVDVLILRTPNLPSTFVNNCVKMRVSIGRFGTRGIGKEVGEDGRVDLVIVDSGRRLYGGGGEGGRVAKRWGWAPNDIFG